MEELKKIRFHVILTIIFSGIYFLFQDIIAEGIDSLFYLAILINIVFVANEYKNIATNNNVDSTRIAIDVISLILTGVCVVLFLDMFPNNVNIPFVFFISMPAIYTIIKIYKSKK